MSNIIQLKDKRKNKNSLDDVAESQLGPKLKRTPSLTSPDIELVCPAQGVVASGQDELGITHWGEATGTVGPNGGAVVVVKRGPRVAEVYRELLKWRLA